MAFVAAVVLGVLAGACGQAAPASPTPTQVTEEARAEQARAAFEALVARQDLSFRFTQVGSSTVNGTPGPAFRYDATVSGGDLAVTTQVNAAELEIVMIGDTMHTRSGAAAWSEAARDPEMSEEILDVWRYAGDPDDLAYVGPAPNHPGGLLYKASKPIPFQTRDLRALGAEGEITSLYLVLETDGAPVLLELNAQAAVELPGGGSGTMLLKSTITFSDVGEPLVVSAPR